MRRSLAKALGVALSACLVSASTPARAEEKQACVRASDRGQMLRDDGKLRAARQEFVACARAACPGIVRTFCAHRIEEMDAALPTVVVHAHGPSGADAVDVRVSVDGALVTTKLDGSPLPMDPGEHTFRFEIDGAPPIEQRVLLRTGEKNRALDVSFAPPPRAPPAAKVVPPSPRPLPPAEVVVRRPLPISSVVVAGAGVLALGASGVLVLLARSDVDELRGRCAPACDDTELDPARTKVLAASIAAGVGAAALAAGVVLYLTRPTEARPGPAVTLGGQPLAGGGLAALRVRF